jgi:hypothetical protein
MRAAAPRLGDETRSQSGILSELRVQHLDRDPLADDQVLGFVDGARGTRTELAKERILAVDDRLLLGGASGAHTRGKRPDPPGL